MEGQFPGQLKDRKGVSFAVIGIVVIIIIAGVGAGAYFAFAGSKSPSSTTSQTSAQTSIGGTTTQASTQTSSQASQTTQPTQSSTSGGGPSSVLVNFYDVLGNFSSFTMEERYNGSSGGGFLNSTFIVTGTTTVNGARAYVVNVTMSSGLPPTQEPSASLVINSSGVVTSFSTQGQSYNGSSATFANTYLSIWGGFTAQTSLYPSLQNQGASTVTIGSAQFQVLTYAGSITSGATTVNYDMKYGTVVGHQLTVVTLFYTSITSQPGYEKYQLNCASLYGQPTCPPS